MNLTIDRYTEQDWKPPTQSQNLCAIRVVAYVWFVHVFMQETAENILCSQSACSNCIGGQVSDYLHGGETGLVE